MARTGIFLLSSCLVLLVSWQVLAKPAEEKYTTKYDNINVDEIINNPRLFRNYLNCLLDKGTCTPEGKELKKNLPDALQTECSKCSDRQKEVSERIIKELIKNHEEDWKKLESLYDSQGLYTKKYKEELEKIKN